MKLRKRTCIKASSNSGEQRRNMRISSYKEFDNGHVLHNWSKMTQAEADELAKQKSIKDPNNIYYVLYDDIMNPDNDERWVAGKKYHYSEVKLEGRDTVVIQNKKTEVSAASGANYSEYTVVTYNGQRYAVHYTAVDNSNEADALQLFRDFKFQITEIHPYDDADYTWAKGDNGMVHFIRNGKIVDKSYYMTAEDWDVENQEWCDVVTETVCEQLHDLNKDVKERIIHNSTRVNRKRVCAATNKGYKYYTKHGLGPGSLPRDVQVLRQEDLGNYMTRFYTDRFLTTKELNDYDIYPETRNSEFDEIYSAVNTKKTATSVPYKGYRIRLLKEGGYGIFDGNGELEDSGFKSIEDSKSAIDEGIKEGLYVESAKTINSSSLPSWVSRYIIVDVTTNEFVDSYTDKKDAEDWVKQLVKDGDFKRSELDIIDSKSDDTSSIVFGSTRQDIYCEEDIEDLPQVDQEYDSAKTSINSNKLPAIYKMISLPKGSVGVDYGGGRFDNAVEALAEQGVTLYVYDPYNRTSEHNKSVLKALRENGGADFAINSNVLNVIKEPEARLNVLSNIASITKSGAPVYITVYEGSGKGNEGVTKSGYQLNKKTADYLEEIQQVFPDAKRKGKLIVATNSDQSITSSTEFEDEWDDEFQDILAEMSAEMVNIEDEHEVREFLGAVLGYALEDQDSYIQTMRDMGILASCDTMERSPIMSSEEYSDDDFQESFGQMIGEIRNLLCKFTGIPETTSWSKQPFTIDSWADDFKCYVEIYIPDVAWSSLQKLEDDVDKILEYYDHISGYAEVTGMDRIFCEALKSEVVKEDIESSQKIEGQMLPGPGDFDPPEYDDPIEVDDYTDYVEFDFDSNIIIEPDGSWDFAPGEDTSYFDGEGSFGDWYSDEYGARIADSSAVAEDFMDLIEKTKLPQPNKAGTYHIKGSATLAYRISGITDYEEFQGLDEDRDPIIEHNYDIDHVDSTFDIANSSITGWSCDRIGN